LGGSGSGVAKSLSSVNLAQSYTFLFKTTSATDTTAPNPPVIASPAGPAWTSGSTYTISGRVTTGPGLNPPAQPNALIKVYRDTNGNHVLDVASDQLVAATQLSGGASSFDVNVGLQTGASNLFLVTATDEAGQTSSAAVVPAIKQNDVK